MLASTLFFGIASLEACAVAAEAQQVDDADDSSRMIERIFDQLYEEDYSGALKAIDGLAPIEPGNKVGRAAEASMRAAALLGLKRKAEAIRLFEEADRLAPDEFSHLTLKYDLALMTDDHGLAGQALDTLIARFPDVVRELPTASVFYLLGKLDKQDEAENEDRWVALAELGYGGAVMGDQISGHAIGILVKRGDVTAARNLLRYVNDPPSIENMLIQRRYAPLWGAIAQHAGPQLQSVRASSVEEAERLNADAPGNESLQLLIDTLRLAGRHNEAIALRAKLPATSKAMVAADEDLGWAVNHVALALHAVGRGVEADTLFALLNDAPMAENSNGWRVSMIINRLELLVGDGKFDRADPLLDQAEATAKTYGNPYAQQLVRRLRYCTAVRLKRKAEAERLFADVLKHAADARHATVNALLCAGEVDKAEELAIASLAEEDFQAALVQSLQPRPLTSTDPSFWSARWSELAKRPRIAAAYAKFGRDMPAELIVPPPPRS